MDSKRKEQLTTDYNIYNQLKCPELIGEPGNVSAKRVVTAVSRNVANYIAAYPLSGINTDYANGDVKKNGFYNGPDHALGSNFFMPIGICGDKSDRDCRGQDRYVYVRNIPTGKIPLIGNVSFHGLTGCNLKGITESRGIVPGLLEDLSDIQPMALMEAVGRSGNYGSYKCSRRSYPVGKNIYDPALECKDGKCRGKTWWWESRCTPSTFHTKTATDGRSRKYPGAPPLFEMFNSIKNDSKRPPHHSRIAIGAATIALAVAMLVVLGPLQKK